MTQDDISAVAAQLTRWQVYAGLGLALLLGWAALLGADGPTEIAALAGNWYPAAAALLPLVLIGSAQVAVRTSAGAAFSRLAFALVICGAVAVVGWLIATLGTMMLVSQLPAIFGSEQASAVGQALRVRLLWQPVLLVGAAALLGGAVAGGLAWYRTRTRR